MSQWLALEGGKLQLTLYGDYFALLKAPEGECLDLPKIGKNILDQQFDFIDEVIGTETEICLKLNDRFQRNSLDQLRVLPASQLKSSCEEGFNEWRLPIWFSDRDDDWDGITEHTGLGRDAYIERLLNCTYRVAMIGFLPGFLYLSGLPRDLMVPRKKTPTKRTERNSFAIGGKYAGIYSLPSPGGWNVVGRSAVDLLVWDHLPPLQIEPGDVLKLAPVDQMKFNELTKSPTSIRDYNGFTHRS